MLIMFISDISAMSMSFWQKAFVGKYGLVNERVSDCRLLLLRQMCCWLYRQQASISKQWKTLLNVRNGHNSVATWSLTWSIMSIADAVHAKGKRSAQLYSPDPILMLNGWFARMGWMEYRCYSLWTTMISIWRCCLVGKITKEEVDAVNTIPVYSGLSSAMTGRTKPISRLEGHGLILQIEEAVRSHGKRSGRRLPFHPPARNDDEHWKAFDKAIHQTYEEINNLYSM